MITKTVDPFHTLYYTERFPYRSTAPGKKRYQATLGIGGNLGDVNRRFIHLLVYMERSPLVNVLQTSPILQNPPFGYLAQPDFFNAVMKIETDLTPKSLMRYLLRVEKKFGRKRSFQDAPRTLDIDMIFFETIRMKSKILTLPHPHWHERKSVVIPLSLL